MKAPSLSAMATAYFSGDMINSRMLDRRANRSATGAKIIRSYALNGARSRSLSLLRYTKVQTR